MRLDIINLGNAQVEEQIEVNDALFSKDVRNDILHRMVTWQLARQRAGVHNVKEIAEISGATRKIYKQKGGGRARHGSLRAPQFRGGAVIFGPHTRSHAFKLNKKVRKIALHMSLALKYHQKSLIIARDVKAEGGKTSALAEQLRLLKVKSALIVDDTVHHNVKCASSNIKYCDALPTVGLNVLDILKKETLILTVGALRKIEERLV